MAKHYFTLPYTAGAPRLFDTDFGVDHHPRVHRDWTPLHRATFEGHLEDVKLLLADSKTDANAREKGDWTPLHFAAQNGDVNIARLLLAKSKADANSKNKDGGTPLHFAAQNGHINILRLLLADSKADANDKTNYRMAPLYRTAPNLKMLVAGFGADANAKDNDGATPLHRAAQKGHVEVVRLLVAEYGVDANAKANYDWTPLHWAALNGHVEVVRLLAGEFRADANAKDNGEWAPLHLAALHGHVEVVRVLVAEFGADANARDNDESTSLHWAAQNGHVEVVRLLVAEFGADANAKDKDGRTPLRCAAQKGHVEIVRLLVGEFGTDGNAKDNDGATLLHCAALNGHVEVVRLLVVEFGVDANAKDNNGATPLYCAAQKGHVEIVRLLVAEFGADGNAKDNDGTTLLHWAPDTFTEIITTVESRLEQSERNNDMLKASLTAREDDLQRTNENLQNIKTQYTHEICKRDQDKDKLKERMQKILNDKYKGANISLTLINPAPKSSTLPTKSGISQNEEMYHDVIKSYEERESEILADYQCLRQSLTNLYQEIKILFHGQVATFSAPIPSESGNNLGAASLPSAPIPGEVARFQMPFNMTGEHIEEDLKRMLVMLKEEMQGREQEIRKKDEEIDRKKVEIEDLIAQLEEKNFVSEEQGKVINHFLSGNFFQGASEEAQLNMSCMELMIHEVDEEPVSLRRMREQLDEERQRFTENAIKLGWDRMALRRERDAFEEEKRSFVTSTMLIDLEKMPSPNSRSSTLDSEFFSSLENSSNPRSPNNRTPFIDLNSVINDAIHRRPAAHSKNEEGDVIMEDTVKPVKRPWLDSTDENNVERRESIAQPAKALSQTPVRRGSVTSTGITDNLFNEPSSTAEQRNGRAKIQQFQMANAKFRATGAVSPSPAATSSPRLVAMASKMAASAVNPLRRPPGRNAAPVSLAPHLRNTDAMMSHTSSTSPLPHSPS